MIKIKKRWLRRTIRVIIVLSLLLIGFVYFFLEGIVISRLESKLNNSYGKSYAITYDEINYSVSFTSLSVQLTNVKIKTDTTEALKINSPIINLESESISVSKVSLWSFFLASEMDINTITIEAPHLSLVKNKEFEIKNKSNGVEGELDISKNIKRFKFDQFIIINGSADFFNDIKMTDTLLSIEELNFKAKKFQSFDENLSELLLIDEYEEIHVESNSFKLNFGENKYTINVKKFKGELVSGDLELMDVHFKPPKSYLRTGEEYRSDILVTKLELFGVQHIMDEKVSLSADSAYIFDTHIDLTKNQALSNQRDKILWMESLQSLKQDIAIDSLKFKNCSLTAEIQKLDGNKNYKLKLTNLNGQISNFNTRGKDKNLTIQLHSNIFNTGELDMTVSLPYNDPFVSNFEGTLSNIDLKSFNDLLVKMYSLKIEEGKLNTLSFKGNSFDNESKGKLTFKYKDLKGGFIKNNNGKRKQAKLISSLLNLVIHSSNPRAGESEPLEVEFLFTKEKYQGQAMLWLGGVIDGTVLTIIGKKKHDYLVKQMD